ncbi:hypothetical protein BCR36DRAFT_92383 [Piromyces finnis]|uniref:C2 domain-containing protein n=1 Tax=Piromyces finnis TaxID=1754191 RepID=A0A1Y1V541_9FUNG|nr:hypothetical protein BCR36DRAFT_92383 [Piromyces finnis]|eukprot:ORX47540.1 hypothetical protein BCR36DRAFT_92383 [Piromyces finnis]
MWKKMEKTQIVKNITSLQTNITINSSNQKILNTNEYYFIPPEPYFAFKQLVELCIFKDCESSFEGEDILSENSRNLIKECEFRWRIPKTFKDIIIIDILIQNYISNFIGINEISDFLQNFIDSIDKSDNIRIHEIEFLCSAFDGLIDKLMNDISHVFQYVKNIRDVQPFILDNYTTIKIIYKSKLYNAYLLRNNIHNDLAKFICDNFKVATDVNYKNIELTSFNTQEKKSTQTIKYFNILRENIDNFQSVNTLHKYNINLLKIISAIYYDNAKRFLPEVCKDGKLEYHFNDLFEIFKFLKNLNEKANYSSNSFVNVEEWFKNFVKIWLSASDETIKSRIENIIKYENYEPINLSQKIYHSDSVLDLFKHFDLVTSSISQVEWSQVTDHANFIKLFSRIINKLIFEYIKRMNISFQKLSFEPGYSEDLYSLVGMNLSDIRDNPVFKEITGITNPELFIKINNIYKAYNLLENICENSEVSYYHSILVSQMKSTTNNDIYNINDVNERYRISIIKIKDISSNSAGFVSPFIEMNLGTSQLFRTNMKQKTLNPEFYEEFILKINENTSSVLEIKIKNGEGKEVTVVGYTKIMLRSILFEDGLIHNLEIPIVPQDHPAFKKYTLEENKKKQEEDEVIAKRQQTRMRMATQRRMKTIKRVQTLMNIVKNQEDDENNPKISHSATVRNDLLNSDLFKDFDYEHLPSHDIIRLIWDRIVQDLHSIILQYYDIYGNSISEKGKLSTKFHNLLNTTMSSMAMNMNKNISIMNNKMTNMFDGNIIFNQKSVSIINNILELLKSFFACEIDNTCYGFPKEELETDCYIELKNFIKLIKENNNYKRKSSY